MLYRLGKAVFKGIIWKEWTVFAGLPTSTILACYDFWLKFRPQYDSTILKAQKICFFTNKIKNIFFF
jgi:hypothetical protein